MCAALDDFAVVEDNDLIAVADRRETVGDHDAGDAPFLDSTDQLIFCLGIEGACRFVHDDDRGILGENAGDLQSLSLAAGHIPASLDDLPFIAIRSLHDIVVDLGVSGSHDDLEIFDRIVPHPDIIGDRIFEEDDILVHDSKGAGEYTAVDLGDLLSVKEDLSAPGLVKP